MSAPARRRHIVVSGRVQGVGFREATRREASRLGLRGWVRNTDDGKVEIVAEGSDDMLAALEAWCARGPAGARVTHVAARDLTAGEALEHFSIRR